MNSFYHKKMRGRGRQERINLGGQEPANGYFQFHFTAEFLKKRYVREVGEEKRFIEEVYLEERNATEERQLVGV